MATSLFDTRATSAARTAVVFGQVHRTATTTFRTAVNELALAERCLR